MSLYSTTVLADSPVAYYRLDEVTGTTAYDSTSNHYDAALNGTFTLNQPGAIIGDSDTCVLFTGAASGLTVPYTLDITTFSAITIEIWLNIVGSNTGWTQTVVTCDGTTTLVYTQGVVTATSPSSPMTIDAAFGYIGSYLTAYMDELSIYSTALSASRVLAHLNNAGYTIPDTVVIPGVNRRAGTVSANRRG